MTLGFRVPLQPRQTLIPVSPGTRTLTVNNQTPARPRRGHLQSESLATTRKLHCIHQNHGRIPLHEPPTQGPHLPHLQRTGRRVPGRREHQPPRAPRRAIALSEGGPSVYVDFTDLPCHAGTPQDLVNPWTLAFGPAGDALYVATDPNHRTVHRFDAAGNLVRAERCADEAPNYLLCV